MASIDEALNELDKRIRLLKVEYDIFIAGGKKIPPNALRTSTEAHVQHILEMKGMNFAQKFRFDTLVARFCAYKELWRKRVQEKEEKGQLRSANELNEMIRHGIAHGPAESSDQCELVTTDPTQQLDRVRALYDFLRDASEKTGTRSFTTEFDKFLHFLQVKTSELRERSKGADVVFLARIDEENKVKFTAKPRK